MNPRTLKPTTLSLSLLASVAIGCSGGSGESVGHEGEAVVVPQGSSTLEGVDVSHYQGSINWGQVKASGRAFAVTSVGDGTYEDPTFASNWAGIKAAGMIRGAYQFFEPGEDPTVQADILIRKVGMLGAGDLPATLDVEVTGGQSGATIAAHIQTWSDRVKAGTGRAPMIYTGKYFWNDNVGSSSFAGLLLWIASYGVSAPDTPNAWSRWKIWQYASTGSVPGIGGNVDVDRFDGTMADLTALASPAVQPPHGYLDAATCDAITGWSQDPAKATSASAVEIFFNGAKGAPGAVSLPAVADVHRSDLCTPLGSCNHGFSLATPRGLKDGKPHDVHAYGVAGSVSAALTNQKTFTCAPPAAPFTNAVKRHVVNGASFASWHFSPLLDVAHYADADVNAYASGDDVPLGPEAVQADDGSPEVWIVDGKSKRHVPDPAAMTAWRITAVKKMPAADVNALTKGTDWPHAPFLVQGSGPAIYMLDGAEIPPGAPGGPAGDAPGAAMPPAADAPAPAAGDSGGANGSSGCSASPVSSDRSSGLALFVAAAAILSARRRRSAR